MEAKIVEAFIKWTDHSEAFVRANIKSMRTECLPDTIVVILLKKAFEALSNHNFVCFRLIWMMLVPMRVHPLQFVCPCTHRNPLHFLTPFFPHDLVEELLSAGVDVNRQDRFGITPLLYVTVKSYLHRGPDFRTDKRNTLLDLKFRRKTLPSYELVDWDSHQITTKRHVSYTMYENVLRMRHVDDNLWLVQALCAHDARVDDACAHTELCTITPLVAAMRTCSHFVVIHLLQRADHLQLVRLRVPLHKIAIVQEMPLMLIAAVFQRHEIVMRLQNDDYGKLECKSTMVDIVHENKFVQQFDSLLFNTLHFLSESINIPTLLLLLRHQCLWSDVLLSACCWMVLPFWVEEILKIHPDFAHAKVGDTHDYRWYVANIPEEHKTSRYSDYVYLLEVLVRANTDFYATVPLESGKVVPLIQAVQHRVYPYNENHNAFVHVPSLAQLALGHAQKACIVNSRV